MKKEETKKPYEEWDFDETLKTFVYSEKKEGDYQTFKNELLKNNYSEEVADIFVRALKIDITKIGKQ